MSALDRLMADLTTAPVAFEASILKVALTPEQEAELAAYEKRMRQKLEDGYREHEAALARSARRLLYGR